MCDFVNVVLNAMIWKITKQKAKPFKIDVGNFIDESIYFVPYGPNRTSKLISLFIISSPSVDTIT